MYAKGSWSRHIDFYALQLFIVRYRISLVTWFSRLYCYCRCALDSRNTSTFAIYTSAPQKDTHAWFAEDLSACDVDAAGRFLRRNIRRQRWYHTRRHRLKKVESILFSEYYSSQGCNSGVVIMDVEAIISRIRDLWPSPPKSEPKQLRCGEGIRSLLLVILVWLINYITICQQLTVPSFPSRAKDPTISQSWLLKQKVAETKIESRRKSLDSYLFQLVAQPGAWQSREVQIFFNPRVKLFDVQSLEPPTATKKAQVCWTIAL